MGIDVNWEDVKQPKVGTINVIRAMGYENGVMRQLWPVRNFFIDELGNIFIDENGKRFYDKEAIWV